MPLIILWRGGVFGAVLIADFGGAGSVRELPCAPLFWDGPVAAEEVEQIASSGFG